MTLENSPGMGISPGNAERAGGRASALRKTVLLALMAIMLSIFMVVPVQAQSTAAFLEEDILGPRDSRVPGDMVVNSWRWYGIDVLPQLVIMGAETSLGNPHLGGRLVQRNNFGCLRYHGPDTKWGVLSSGRAWVGGRDWYAFPSPEIGVMALGRYLKVGADGHYKEVLNGPPYDWESFAAVYYGRSVPGYWNYVERLRRLERSFRAEAAENGFSW